MRLYETIETESEKDVVTYDQPGFESEEDLEDQLHRNPELILDEQIFLVGRQVRLDTGVADLVGLDRFGNVTVIELKVGRSGSGSASEETILSQPQNYAQSLSSFDYENLNELYQQYHDRMERGEWDVSEDLDCGGNLLTGFEAAFGEAIEEHQFNTTQRMVVVAEEITRRTEQNVRYLLSEGLNFQCSEVQAFLSPDKEANSTILVTHIVVDYPMGRVRPKDRPSPTYPALVNDIVERAYPNFQSVTNAASMSELFPEGVDQREPQLVSQNGDHPTSIRYRLAPKPDDGTVVIAIDVQGEQVSAVSRLQEAQARFGEVGFDVTGNQTYRVVTRKWDLEAGGGLNEELLDEIAESFAALVQLGHEALTAGNHGDGQ